MTKVVSGVFQNVVVAKASRECGVMGLARRGSWKVGRGAPRVSDVNDGESNALLIPVSGYLCGNESGAEGASRLAGGAAGLGA